MLIIEVNLGLNHRQNRRGKDQRIITVLLLTEMGFIFFFFFSAGKGSFYINRKL